MIKDIFEPLIIEELSPAGITFSESNPYVAHAPAPHNTAANNGFNTPETMFILT